MKMMGVPNFLHWAAWFTKSLIFLSITTLLLVALLTVTVSKGLAIITHADPIILLLFLMAYVLSAICFSFLMSTIFSKGNVDSQFTYIMMKMRIPERLFSFQQAQVRLVRAYCGF